MIPPYGHFVIALSLLRERLGIHLHINLRRLTTLQKRFVRIMPRNDFDAHTDPLFQNSRILNLESIYKLQIGKFMYLYKSGSLPHSLNTVKPLLGGPLLSGLLSIPKFPSHIYCKFDLYSTVSSIKWTRSPFGFPKRLI